MVPTKISPHPAKLLEWYPPSLPQKADDEQPHHVPERIDAAEAPMPVSRSVLGREKLGIVPIAELTDAQPSQARGLLSAEGQDFVGCRVHSAHPVPILALRSMC